VTFSSSFLSVLLSVLYANGYCRYIEKRVGLIWMALRAEISDNLDKPTLIRIRVRVGVRVRVTGKMSGRPAGKKRHEKYLKKDS
jgi:hypothetical protein